MLVLDAPHNLFLHALPNGHLPRLETILLPRMNQVPRAVVALQGSTQLRRMAVSGPTQLQASLENTHLTHLSLMSSSISVPLLHDLQNLTYLNVRGAESIFVANASAPGILPNLDTLCVHARGLRTYRVLAFFATIRTPRLKSLSLDCDWRLMGITITAIGERLQALPLLERLRVAGPNPTPYAICQLAAATPRLQALEITHDGLYAVTQAIERVCWVRLERITLIYPEARLGDSVTPINPFISVFIDLPHLQSIREAFPELVLFVQGCYPEELSTLFDKLTTIQDNHDFGTDLNSDDVAARLYISLTHFTD